MKPQLALAFSGGGAKSAAQAGALEVLEQTGLPIGFLTGVSAGGLVATLYGAGFSPRAIRDYIAETHLLEIWELDPQRLGLFGAEKIRARLREMVGDQTFADLKIPVTLIAVDLNTGCEVRLNRGPLAEALLATMAIPGLFTPVVRDGLHLIDGGALNPLPVDVARASGHRVVAVDVLQHQPPVGTPVQLFESRGPMRYAADLAEHIGLTRIMESIHQTAVVMTRNVANLNLKLYPPDLLLTPEVGSIGLFAADRAPEAYLKGIESAELALPQLENLLQSSLTAPITSFPIDV